MRYRSAAIAGVVGVAALALVVLFAVSPSGGKDEVSTKLLGNLAPSVSGKTLSGDDFNLDRLRGEWVLVNFFASWCAPCVQEHPELRKLSKDDGGPLQVVSVAFNDTPDEIRKFFADNGGRWPVIVPDLSAPDSMAFDYGVKALPESFLVSPNGKVAAKFEGGIQAARIERQIADLTADGSTSESEEGGS